MQASNGTWEHQLLTTVHCRACATCCGAEFEDVFVTGICEVADEVMPGDIYCCVERIQVWLQQQQTATAAPDTAAAAAAAAA
jgi:hypothetical protein